MEKSEQVKQFRVSLYNDSIIIDTPSNLDEAFSADLNVKHELKIGEWDWIETKENALNYAECCGVMILFGIQPPTFEELYNLLS